MKNVGNSVEIGSLAKSLYGTNKNDNKINTGGGAAGRGSSRYYNDSPDQGGNSFYVETGEDELPPLHSKP